MFFFSTSYLLHGHGDAMMVLMVVTDEVACRFIATANIMIYAMNM